MIVTDRGERRGRGQDRTRAVIIRARAGHRPPRNYHLKFYCLLSPPTMKCDFPPLTAATQGPASIPDQLAAAAVAQSLPSSFTNWGTQRKLALSCYPCKGKEWLLSSTCCQILHSKNSIVQHWKYNLLLLGSSAKEPLVPFFFFQRLVTLKWA